MTNIVTRNGTAISKLCFGCMQFGGTATPPQSQAMFDACRSAGVNFFDTAHVYTDGVSERLLGAFAKPNRDDLVIATKVAYTGGSGRQNIIDSFDQSRARLGMDDVDILYLHRWDDHTPLEDTFDALATLQSAGRLRYIGVSNFAAWQVMKAQSVARKFDTQIDIIQPMYSLIKRQAEVELLPMASSEGIAAATYSPLGGGVLTGKYAQGGTGRLSHDARYAARYAPDWMGETAVALSAFAAACGHDPATLAVAWTAQQPGVTAPIISARNTAQLAPSLAATDMVLSVDEVSQISALSPTPAPATDRLEET